MGSDLFLGAAMEKQRLIAAISGVSGAPLALTFLRHLRAFPDIEVHLICSRGGELTLTHETGQTLEDLRPFVHPNHPNHSLGADPASGSFRTMEMVVVLCSMKTLTGTVIGYSDSLLLRAADVTMKERRLVLIPREYPDSLFQSL